jgi:hypothetical protein
LGDARLDSYVAKPLVEIHNAIEMTKVEQSAPVLSRYTGAVSPIPATTDRVKRNAVLIGRTHALLNLFPGVWPENQRDAVMDFEGCGFRGCEMHGVGIAANIRETGVSRTQLEQSHTIILRYIFHNMTMNLPRSASFLAS